MLTFLIIQNQYFLSLREANSTYHSSIFLKKDFLSPGHDRVVTIKSRNFFLLRKFGVVWVYIDLPGAVIWQNIHGIKIVTYENIIK